MRSLLAVLALVACSKPSSTCPSVDDLMRPGAIRKEIEVVVGLCRADGWSAAATKCLRDAPTDEAMEKCFDMLSATQKEHLAAGFEPSHEALDREAAAETRAFDQQFKTELDAMKLEQLSARAPQCADYLAAIDAGRKVSLGCASSTDKLALYGFQQTVKAQVKRLMAITDDQALGAACVHEAGELRSASSRICDP
jgi:hypothetical protein